MTTDASTVINTAVGACGGVTRLSKLLGISQGAVSNWLIRRSKISPRHCAAIERATCGAVTCGDLRPDVAWLRVPDPDWPHPGGRPLIDVAAGHELAGKAGAI